MGKGKGSPTAWIYRPHLNKPFAILSLLSSYRINVILIYLKKYLHKYIFVKKKNTWNF